MKRLLNFIRQMSLRIHAQLSLRDVFVFGGLAALAHGVAQVSVPLAWVVGGGVIMLLGLRR